MIVNGEVTGYFNSKLGLRQSCPLSLFLFSIVIDLLSCLLNKKVEVGKFTPLSHGPYFHISHLLFADDVLIFGKSNSSTTVSLRNSLISWLYIMVFVSMMISHLSATLNKIMILILLTILLVY